MRPNCVEAIYQQWQLVGSNYTHLRRERGGTPTRELCRIGERGDPLELIPHRVVVYEKSYGT